MAALAIGYVPHLAMVGTCSVACFIADLATGTTPWHNRKAHTMFDQDPTPELLDSLESPDLDGWDDLTGVDIDGEAGEVLLTGDSVAWLSSLLYSDYADPSDDDDRVAMNIPRHLLDSLTGMEL